MIQISATSTHGLQDRSGTVRTAHGPLEAQAWGRLQTLYAFCRARCIERLVVAGDPANVRKQRRQLHVLESMYCKARQHGDIVTGCAVTYFRAQALQDADHPNFRGEWS